MGEELVDRPALRCVLFEAFLDEVAVGRGELELVESVRVFGGDEVHGLEGWHSQEGRLAFRELDCDHAHRPHIHQLVVELFFDELRRHPCRRSHN